MKKIKITLLVLLSAVCALCLFAGCSGGLNTRTGIKVTYDLCGGKYKNSSAPIVVYYRFPENVKHYIKSLPVAENSNAKVEYVGNNFDGWYTDKDYKNVWNFETDEVVGEELTLYAKWSPKIEYNYAVGYKDENEEFVTVATVKTYVSWTFAQSESSIMNLSDQREGYTFLKKLTLDADDEAKYFENGKIKESTENVLIKVYAEYMKGEYFIISSREDFDDIDDYAYKGKTILLMNDIDCGGDDLTTEFIDMFNLMDGVPKYYGLTSYDPENKGVTYKISNFTVERNNTNYDSETGTLTASLFGDICGGEDENGKVIVNIENVAFDNVSILVDPWFLNIKNIEYSLFARELKDVSIKNVKASISFVIDTLRKNDGHTFLEADGKYFTSQENASVVGCDFGEFKYYVTEMTGDGKEVFVPSDMEGNKL